ncbi:MAG TPA: UDP-N-acetylmuramoyl-tripeptide--D-alanyl-D-alanine ligase [Chitinophagaceae bacterium]|nr:UDP-N-acetylmuramoyl-tripeptide--D-alanyl-D-alanine ligase [Chitinophagaceae bacterium]
MTIEELYVIYRQYPSVQTDTRVLKAGDIFFALKGPNFNGNKFASRALEAGAEYAVIDEAEYKVSDRTVLVDDVLTTLQQLAKYHRQQFNNLPDGRQVPFIAITGSNGKTTTKELVHAVLSSTYKTYTTAGNLNNHIGIPVTLLRIKQDAEMAVIEMGANHLGEIAGYCEYTLPTHGIITNCGKAHLEGFGGIEGVRKGKGELYNYLRAHNGTVFAFDDYDYLHEMSKGIADIVWYGTKQTGHIIKNEIKNEPFLSIELTDKTTIATQLAGDYNLPNVLCAAAVGKHFGISNEVIKKAIGSYAPSNSRSQLIEKDSNKIILDAYNANPSSMKAAIENIAHKAGDKVLLLGAMAELGAESLEEHKAVIDLVSQYSWKAVALVGGDFLKTSHPYLSFENAAQAGEWYQQQQYRDTTILVKGSRSMQMEKILA